MATYVGIDIGTTQVKVAVVRGGGRKWSVDRLVAIDRVANDAVAIPIAVEGAGPEQVTPAPVQTLDDVVIEAAREATRGGDPLSIGFDGEHTFVRTLEVPAAVRRRVAEVLPFELEAQLPFDIEDAIWDHRLRPGMAVGASQPVLVTAAKLEDVRERIDLVKRSLRREPDHVVPGAFAFADLAAILPPFKELGLRAIVDLGLESSELLVLDGAEPLFARTLSRGVQGMPQSAQWLARDIRQSLASFRASGGDAPTIIYLTGGGALIRDLTRWLSGELQLPVELLPIDAIDGLSAQTRRDALGDGLDAHRFSRAVGIALSAVPRRRGVDLRRGPLAYERGFGFLREKVPLLAGLGTAILVTFLFATWARARNLGADRAVLDQVLGQTAKDVLGEQTTNTQRIDELLARGGTITAEEDPLPRADAMDVMVQLSELIPQGKKHDVEKLEIVRNVQGGFKITLKAIAPTSTDIDTILNSVKSYRCFNNPNVTGRSKSGDDREKYTMEIELRCPEEGGGASNKPKPAGSTGK